MSLRTVVVAASGATVLVASLGVGYLLGRADEPDRPTPTPLRLANADLTSAASCESLLSQYVERGLARVGPYGWDGGIPITASVAQDQVELAAPLPGGAAAEAKTTRATNNEAGTNVQEAGVDEPDVVKVSGSLLVRMQGSTLRVYDVAGQQPEQLSGLFLRTTDRVNTELLLVDDRVVVLQGEEFGTEATVTTIDLSDPREPEITDTTTITGSLRTARLHDDVVRLVIGSGLPELDFRFPDDESGVREARSHNEQLVRETTLTDWLPSINGKVIADCGSVAVPSGDAELGTTTILAFRPDSPTESTISAVATASATSYFSPQRLYLAVNPTWAPVPRDCWGPCVMPWNGENWGGGRVAMPTPSGTTDLYAFELDGADTTYVASGEVEGTIADRWAMDAVGSSLRVAVGPSSETGNFNSVLTLREQGAELVEAGRVDKLGVNEQIKSVRWFDELAIVVTFRQTDPLYAVDLTDPADPELIGELKIPGFSEYLHPLGSQRMIGMGQDASLDGMIRGAQAALFDVSDLTAPRQLDVVRYAKGSHAGAGVDPRQFTWLPDRRTALTVVSEGWNGRTGWVSVLSLADSELHNKMVEVEYGDDVDQVRLVPLASGKVVLITGEDVSFFDF